MNLKKNIIYNSIYQFLIIFLPFITTPYLTRTIGANGIGIYSYSYSIALYFTYFTLLGLNNYGNRLIASVQNDIEKRTKYFCEVYTMQLTLFVLCVLIYLLYVFFLADNFAAAAIQIIFVCSSVLDINWFFFGMEQFKITIIRNSIVKISAVICVFIFVKTSNDFNKYILIMASSFFVSQLCLWPFMKKFIRAFRLDYNNFFLHLKNNLALFIPVISVSIYKIMDKVMLGKMTNMVELGFYECAERIVIVPVSIVTAVGTVMLPRMTAVFSNNDVDKANKYIDYTMMFVLAFANISVLGMISISKEFSAIYYGSGFDKIADIINFLSITVLFLSFGNVLRTQYLIPLKYDRVYIMSAVLGAVANLVINYILIPKMNSIGAAIGTIAAEFMVCAYQVYFVRKKIKLETYLKEEVCFLALSILTYLVITNIKVTSSFTTMVLRIAAGTIIYGVLTMLYMIKFKHINLRKLILG